VATSRPRSFAIAAPTLPPGGLYWNLTRTRVPRPGPATSKLTEPALTTSEPSIDRHPITWFGTSLMISAFHSTSAPPGPFARQRESVSVTRSTDSRCLMKRGRFSRSRQKRYSSSTGRLIVTLSSTFTPALPPSARRVSLRVSAVLMSSA